MERILPKCRKKISNTHVGTAASAVQGRAKPAQTTTALAQPSAFRAVAP